MPRLVIITPESQSEAELAPHNTIGRHPGNTIQVLDRLVSKEHCHIDLVDDRYLLRDLGSLNGSYVNGQRIHEWPLSHGDEISIGQSRLIYQAPLNESRRPTHHYAGGNVPAANHATPIAGVSALAGLQAAAILAGANPNPSSSGAGSSGSAEVSQSSRQRLASFFPEDAPQSPVRIQKVTIAGDVESHIRSKLAAPMQESFLPEASVQDVQALRRDYEKLRISYELARSIGVELDVHRVLDKILDAAFQLLPADRAVILLLDERGDLVPRSVRSRAGVEAGDMLISRTIVDQVLREKAAFLSNDATVDSRFQNAHSIIMQGIRSSMAVPLLHSGEILGVMLLDSQVAVNAFGEKDLQLFQNVANQAAIAIQNSLYARKLEQEAITRQRFQKLLSPAIAQQVLDGVVEIKKGGERRTATVLFSDIRGFTSMSEDAAPESIVDMLNEYFELMVEVIFNHEGTLDKFVGDEIMALFGAPVSHPDDSVRAVRTALEMKAVLSQFNTERRAAGLEEVFIGIGINTGECVAGYLGSSKALEYTVIGDTVNTGARLCSTAKADQILVSEATLMSLGGRFEFEELPPVQVKGKSRMLRIFNILSEHL